MIDRQLTISLQGDCGKCDEIVFKKTKNSKRIDGVVADMNATEGRKLCEVW